MRSRRCFASFCPQIRTHALEALLRIVLPADKNTCARGVASHRSTRRCFTQCFVQVSPGPARAYMPPRARRLHGRAAPGSPSSVHTSRTAVSPKGCIPASLHPSSPPPPRHAHSICTGGRGSNRPALTVVMHLGHWTALTFTGWAARSACHAWTLRRAASGCGAPAACGPATWNGQKTWPFSRQACPYVPPLPFAG